MVTRIFIHGLDSSNQGTKARFFKERLPDMLMPNFPGSLEERIAILRDVLDGKSEIILVGSSFGGLMATLFTLEEEKRVKRMVLLAPALNMLDLDRYAGRTVSVPVWIYHGIHDGVIPLEEVKAIAPKLFPRLTFVELDDDHMLHTTFRDLPWDELLA
ncbi:MAG: alpha/beta fold hydrolase [Deltaproteobacteria bacterium]|nr:alpha/beta fold hydrolase [Deltaproteobacteria bacterium]MBW1927706.1 alpha/beta fold hydrolase [Deltaproteobacteria bacterium]MBW2025111.1 alpha/beta fold hydrolase [Deltaproteobacteria bacterium]MBW2125835.1 alpha/beta fold hydrolase [Deltaproteobacteria bacterium]